MTLEWTLRDEPLALCPEAWCRRAEACRNAGTGTPCLRTHEDMDDVRNRLADTIEGLMRAHGITPSAEPVSDYELELRLAELKRLLQERDQEDTERRMALAASR